MKLSEAARRVIDLASKIYDYYDIEMRKWHPNYPLVNPDEEEPPPPPEDKELRDFLLALPEDMVYQLLLLMDLGRSRIKTDELEAHYEELKGGYGGSEQAVSLMMYFAPLASYLSEGLEELRRHKINVDKLPLKKVSAHKH